MQCVYACVALQSSFIFVPCGGINDGDNGCGSAKKRDGASDDCDICGGSGSDKEVSDGGATDYGGGGGDNDAFGDGSAKEKDGSVNGSGITFFLFCLSENALARRAVLSARKVCCSLIC